MGSDGDGYYIVNEWGKLKEEDMGMDGERDRDICINVNK